MAPQRRTPHAATALPDGDALERDSRAAVRAILDLLGARIVAALLEVGLTETVANDAADKAVAVLANAIANDGQHAAQIVHAILERLQAGQTGTDEVLLHLAARGLNVIVDHADGAVRVEGPALSLGPAHSGRAMPPPLHLLDITDGHGDDAAPVFRILGAVRDAALAAARPDFPERAAAPRPAPPLVVAPGAFAEAIARRVAPALAAAAPVGVLPSGLSAAPADAPHDLARVVSRIVAQAVGSAGRTLTVAEAVAAVEALAPVAAAPPGAASAPAGPESRQVFAAGKIAIAFEPRHGSVTVRIGERITAYAPASLAPPSAWLSALPGLAALPLPVVGLSPVSAPAPVLGGPRGVPFVPPDIATLAAAAEGRPAGTARPSAETAVRAAAQMDAETIRLIETAVARNATVLRALLVTPAGDEPRTTRIALDIGAAVIPIAPGMQPQTPPIGRFGLPNPAPVKGEAGPVRDGGHLDATATNPPVLPAWQAAGVLPPPAAKKRARPALPAYARQPVSDDAFDREMPSGFEGLVFTMVTVSA